MLTESELHDLAESIKAEGQHKPIILDRDGVLLDGRNRLAACKLAGIEPRFTTYDGHNRTGLIFSNNVLRRHISKGQQAMITAMACSLSGHSLRTQAKLHDISRSRISAANVVLKYAPDLAERVRVGKLGLDAAHDQARERKARTEALLAQHERLQQHAPDLAEKVTEGLLTLDAAITTLDRRLEEEQLRQLVKECDAIRLADGDTAPALTQLAERGEITWDQAAQRAEEHRAHRHEAILRTQHALQLIAENWATVHDLAARRGTPYAKEILDGLTPEAHALATHLTTRAA
ncbi:ParB N-terminal domain-containing protein [Streptomyces antarcticus]|uniref:ParB N-terminal domain-containing protein n=1 Tax=Streptomyces antarcticus TaxID=2996458 RepID=UPI00226DFED4|nr:MULTISPECIES: ParB N-terminal domain-containing protein [unclassified Streptomyces]MCY0943620.1 ParB N-terminal domain-containing protein [Streptomyces sp. H34-AA3]MCZ4086032.1 ParB N-terminal domain-containing protein [Streptomyces sp. H34-S5]